MLYNQMITNHLFFFLIKMVTEAASELIRTRVAPNTCLDLLSSILLSCFLFPYDAVGQKGEKTKLSFHGQVVQE